MHGLPGDPDQPISEPERLAKARSLMEPRLGPTRSGALIEHWMEAPLQAPLLPPERLTLKQLRRD